MADPQIVYLRPNFKPQDQITLEAMISQFHIAQAEMDKSQILFNRSDECSNLQDRFVGAILERNRLALELCKMSPKGVQAVAKNLNDVIQCVDSIDGGQVLELCIAMANHIVSMNWEAVQ